MEVVVWWFGCLLDCVLVDLLVLGLGWFAGLWVDDLIWCFGLDWIGWIILLSDVRLDCYVGCLICCDWGLFCYVCSVIWLVLFGW